MSNTRAPIAIIPARGGSKRIPRKNIADVNGKPLLAYPVKTCLASGLFSEIIVSTEDVEIADVARRHGAEVEMRPYELAQDNAPASFACRDLLLRRYSDENRPVHFCMVYPMAIFLEPEDLIDSMDKLEDCDGVMGVSDFAIHPFKALVEKDGFLAALWPELNLQQSQYYPRTLGSNGTFYWGRTESFVASPGFYPERLKPHIIPPWRAIDIDTPDDLEHARRVKLIETNPS